MTGRSVRQVDVTGTRRCAALHWILTGDGPAGLGAALREATEAAGCIQELLPRLAGAVGDQAACYTALARSFGCTAPQPLPPLAYPVTHTTRKDKADGGGGGGGGKGKGGKGGGGGNRKKRGGKGGGKGGKGGAAQ